MIFCLEALLRKLQLRSNMLQNAWCRNCQSCFRWASLAHRRESPHVSWSFFLNEALGGRGKMAEFRKETSFLDGCHFFFYLLTNPTGTPREIFPPNCRHVRRSTGLYMRTSDHSVSWREKLSLKSQISSRPQGCMDLSLQHFSRSFEPRCRRRPELRDWHDCVAAKLLIANKWRRFAVELLQALFQLDFWGSRTGPNDLLIRRVFLRFDCGTMLWCIFEASRVCSLPWCWSYL